MKIQQDILAAFPGLTIADGGIGPLSIRRKSLRLDPLRTQIISWIQSRYTLEGVRDEPLFRAYRDFFWSVGVDPTRTRPASEALVRRILAGKPLPEINTAVDAYNLASIRSGIPIAAFDADTLSGELIMRFADAGDRFLGIGMQKPIILHDTQVILADGDEIVAIYPYRDSEATKITIDTEMVHLVSCGVPKVEREVVNAAYDLACDYLREYASSSPRRVQDHAIR